MWFLWQADSKTHVLHGYVSNTWPQIVPSEIMLINLALDSGRQIWRFNSQKLSTKAFLKILLKNIKKINDLIFIKVIAGTIMFHGCSTTLTAMVISIINYET